MKYNSSPRIDNYLKQVFLKLNLSKETKQRICSDLNTTITAKLEAGQTEDAILADLGSPAEVAAEFNRQMADQIPKQSPWRIVCLIAAFVSAAVLLGKVAIHLLVNDFINGMTRTVGIIGGADGPTSVFITSSVTERVDGSFFFWLAILVAGITGYFLLKKNNYKENLK